IVKHELFKHDNDAKTAAEIAKEISYFREQQGKWCSLMVSRAALVAKVVSRFEQVISKGDRRHQQNMSTLLAGAFVSLHGRLPTDDELRAWGDEFAAVIETHAEEQERDDGQECLDYLLAHPVRSHDYGDMPLRHWLA